MASVPFLVMLPTQDSMPARTLVNGVEGMVVMAESTADAIAMCKSQSSADNDVAWDNATATAIVADTDLHGWTLDIVINASDTGALVGHVAVTAGASNDPAVAATGVLTSSENYAATDTVTIHGKTYTFVSPIGSTEGNVLVGADEATSIANLAAAINHGAGAGTAYVAAAANPDVSAVAAAHTLTVTAKVAGTAANAFGTTVSMHAPGNGAWGAVTLTGGLDADTFDTLAAAAVTALNAGGFGVTHASYNGSSNVLTVAGTADNLGDHDLVVSMLPADRVRDVAVPGLIGTITDEGLSTAALTVALGADNFKIPLLAAGVRQVV